MGEEKPFRFLSGAEFSQLDAEAKAQYLLDATKALAAMTEELTRDIKRRDDQGS